MKQIDLKPGWMKEQFDRASKDVKGWSHEMKMMVPEWWSCCGVGYPYNTTTCIKCGSEARPNPMPGED